MPFTPIYNTLVVSRADGSASGPGERHGQMREDKGAGSQHIDFYGKCRDQTWVSKPPGFPQRVAGVRRRLGARPTDILQGKERPICSRTTRSNIPTLSVTPTSSVHGMRIITRSSASRDFNLDNRNLGTFVYRYRLLLFPAIRYRVLADSSDILIKPYSFPTFTWF